MRRAINLTAVTASLIATLLLAACKGTNSETPTPTSAAGLTETVEPTEVIITFVPPGTVEATQLTEVSPSGGYPPPGGETATPTTSSGTPYPAPQGPAPSPTLAGTSTPAPIAQANTPTATEASTAVPTATIVAYPGPGAPTATSAAVPTTGAYPGPGESPTQAIQPTTGPYPGPTDVNATTPNATTAATVAPGTALEPSATPTITMTPMLVRTALHASDPRTFQIVSGKVQLVEFFAFWSPASKSMAPIMNSLEDTYGSRINFIFLDIDDPANSMFKDMLKDRLPPVFYLLDGQGVIIQQWSGIVEKDLLEAAILSNAP